MQIYLIADISAFLVGGEEMKCPKCGKIWSEFNNIASNIYICPYCGDNFASDGEVREDISQILKKLIEDFGKDVLLDVNRTNALLMDYAPHSEKERKLIVMVMKEGILSKLLCLTDKTDDEKKFGINKCIKQLISDIWITEVAARYAITVLANAVGCLSGNDFGLMEEISVQDNASNNTQMGYETLSKGTDYRNEEEIKQALEKCDCIGFKAFAAQLKLENINLPVSIKTIYPKAFLNCTNLRSITLPQGVQTIGTCAFEGCSSLEEIRISDGGNYKVLDGVLIDKKEKRTVRAENSSKRTDISITNGITTITKRTFDRCPVKTITLPASVEQIEEGAFFLTMELERFVVDGKNRIFRSIDGVLHNRSGKKIIRYPQGMHGVSYYLEDSVEEIGYQAFSCTKNLQSITFTGSLKEIGSKAFEFCGNLENLMLPGSVEVIGERAFQYCAKLRSAMLSRSIVVIGDCAFFFFFSLETISVPKLVERIGNLAFADCSNLKSVTVQDNISFIGDGAFVGCPAIEVFIKNNDYVEMYCKSRNISYKRI